MNDLRAERRRLKRERIRATIAMRRARDRSEDTGVDEILLADTSDSSETDDSDDYSLSHKVGLPQNCTSRLRAGFSIFHRTYCQPNNYSGKCRVSNSRTEIIGFR